MNLNSIRTKIFLIPALAVVALLMVSVFNGVMESRLSESEQRTDIGREIAFRMNNLLADEIHFYHHVHEKLFTEILEEDNKISTLILSLAKMDNSLPIGSALSSLARSFINDRIVFSEISDIVTDIEKQNRDLVRKWQELDYTLSRAIEAIAQDETHLIMEGKYQYGARKEFGNILKEILSYPASATLNINNLLKFSDLEEFNIDEERLSKRIRLLTRAGRSLSSVSGRPQDLELWKNVAAQINAIDTVRAEIFQNWKIRQDSASNLYQTGELVVLGAENVQQLALTEFKAQVQMRSNVVTIIMLTVGFTILVLGYFLTHSIGISLKALQEGTVAISRGDLEYRTLIDTKDEIGDLSRAFDSMADKLAKSSRELAHEINQRKTVQGLLQASETKYRDLFEHIQDTLIIVDLESHLIEGANQIALDTFGYTRAEFANMKVTDLASGNEKEKVIRNMENMAKEKMTSRRIFSRIYEHKNGNTFHAEVSASKITIAGRPKLIGSIRDVTERRMLESQLQHSEKLESLGILAGGIAHDFNNILMGVMGHAGMALMKLPEDSSALDNLRNIETAAQRLRELTDQLLAYSGRGKFESTTINISELVEDLAKLLAAMLPKEVETKYNLDPDMPAFRGIPPRSGRLP